MIDNVAKSFHQNVTKNRIEYIEFSSRYEHARRICFNGDVLSVTSLLV